jgi:uncharacterized membrane protein YhhN
LNNGKTNLKKMKTAVSAILYFLTGVVFILFQRHLPVLPVFILKALIIPLLILLFLVNLKPSRNRLHLLMIAGLIFSWAGDVFLEVPQGIAEMFIPGLASFLLAHVMYLTVFFTTKGENVILIKRPYLLLPILLAGAVLIYYLYDGLGEMRIPVILYAVIILTMLAGALNRFGKVNNTSFILVLTGAILFVISDSGIAINKFNHHFRGAAVLIMGTYILAQFLIVAGYIKQYNNKFE